MNEDLNKDIEWLENQLKEDSKKYKEKKPFTFSTDSAIVITLILIAVIVFATFFTGFHNRTDKNEPSDYRTITGQSPNRVSYDLSNGRFEIIDHYLQNDGDDHSINYYIAYDKVTKVIYLIGKAEGSSPTFTIMLGKEGHPLIYAGKGE